MAEEVLLTLGDYQFSMSTAAHDSLSRSSSYRWAAQQRLGREPALQYTGPGGESISLKGSIYPHFRGGLEQLTQMRGQAEGGQPLALVDGRGNNLGDWCITEIKETETSYVGPGIPRKINFSVSLTAYGPDQQATNSDGSSGSGDLFNWLALVA